MTASVRETSQSETTDPFSAITGVASRCSDLLLRVVDGGLAGIIFVAPYFLGGRHPFGRFIVVVLAVVIGVAWFTRQCFVKRGRWTWSAGGMLCVAGALLIVFQIAPLPAALLTHIAPSTAKILPMWFAGEGSGSGGGGWSRISMTPDATRAGLALFLAYALVFLVAVERLRRIEDVERILRWIALAVVIMAGFGIIQYLTANGKFLWVYEHPFRDNLDVVKGSFANRNHFTHLLALGIGPLAMWLVLALRRTQQAGRFGAGGVGASPVVVSTLLAMAFGIVLLAGLMSLSRGGILAIAASLIACGIIFSRASLLSWKLTLATLAMAILVGAALFIHGADRLANRLRHLSVEQLADYNAEAGRRHIWQANLSAFRGNPWFGTGIGSHREVYPIYLRKYFSVEFTHAESGYLQVATESGLAGLALLVTGIGLCLYWCLSGLSRADSPRVIACLGAVAGGFAASLLHAFVDFVWYIPACITFTILLAACALRLSQFARGNESAVRAEFVLPRPAWIAVAALMWLVGIWGIVDRLGPAVASFYWDDYLRTSIATKEWQESQRRAATREDSAGDSIPAAFDDKMAVHLQKVLHWHPTHARAHLRLASIHLRRFDQLQKTSPNPMELKQIREAALASKFPSREKLDEWLSVAVGDHRRLADQALWHTRRGLELCPLQGEGYIYLADLCFLEGQPPTAVAEFVEQALKVRPIQADVLIEAGREAAIAGDIAGALEFWKTCFQLDGTHQKLLIDQLAQQVPVTFFLQSFEPDRFALRMLHVRYRNLASPEEYRVLSERYAEVAEHEAARAEIEKAGMLWFEAFQLHVSLQAHQGARRCAEAALAARPDSYQVRYAVGFWLLEQGQFAQAEEHFRWCLRRRPNDHTLQKQLKLAIRGGVVARPQSSARKTANKFMR